MPDFDQNSPEVTAEVTGPKVLFEAKLVAAEDPAENSRKTVDLSDVKLEKFSSLQRLLRIPKLLPAKEYYTRLVIEDCHCKTMHSGVSQTLAETHKGYWIPQGRSQVKKVLNSCKVCRRVEGGSFSMPKMPPWPKERVGQSFPFEYTGLDYLGPLYIKVYSGESNQPTTKKVWYVYLHA